MLFYRGTSPSDLDSMSYFDLRYWAHLVELAIEAERKLANQGGNRP